MADLNNCTFSGRLTRDAEQKTLPSGTTLVAFDMAVNTGWGDREKVMYITVNLWGKKGESLYPYLLKGKNVGVAGELEQQKWMSKATNTEQQKLVLSCSNFVFLQNAKAENVPYSVVDDEEDIAF